jgi:uncharacterized protein YggT (Ycf19 family)
MATIENANLAADESRRISQHEAVKDQIRGDVHQEIAARAEPLDPVEQRQADVLADDLKQKAIHEVAETEAEIDRARGIARVSQIVDYVFYIAYGLIGLEIFLELLGANDRNDFKQFVDTISAPLLAPFAGLMPTPTAGPFRLVLSYVAALAVYLLIHLAVNGLLRLFVHRKVAV